MEDGTIQELSPLHTDWLSCQDIGLGASMDTSLQSTEVEFYKLK